MHGGHSRQVDPAYVEIELDLDDDEVIEISVDPIKRGPPPLPPRSRRPTPPVVPLTMAELIAGAPDVPRANEPIAPIAPSGKRSARAFAGRLLAAVVLACIAVAAVALLAPAYTIEHHARPRRSTAAAAPGTPASSARQAATRRRAVGRGAELPSVVVRPAIQTPAAGADGVRPSTSSTALAGKRGKVAGRKAARRRRKKAARRKTARRRRRQSRRRSRSLSVATRRRRGNVARGVAFVEVRITSRPRGAVVTTALGRLGVTPLTALLPRPRALFVTLSHRGYRPRRVRWDGQRRRLVVTLARAR